MPDHQTSQLLRRAATVLPLAASLVVGLLGCAEPDRILVSGNVDDDLVKVHAPQLEIPKPDFNAGFADTPAAPSPPATSLPAAVSMSWNRIAAVEVGEGDQVQAGEVVARVDSEALIADLRAARADAKVAASQVPVLDSAIDKTYDKEDSVKSALKKINKAIRQLKGNRAKLSGQVAQAQQQLPQLEAKRAQVVSQAQQLRDQLSQVNQQLAELQRVLAQIPPQHPSGPTPSTAPSTPNRKQLLSQIAQLQQARSRLQSGLEQTVGADAQLTTAIAGVRTGIPKLESAVRQIDAGLAKARSQRVKLRKAKAKIIEARAELRRNRKLAIIAADASKVGIDIAKNQKLLATVTAPASGLVVHAAAVGEVVAAGATIVTIRKSDGATSFTTWLVPAQLAQICLGSQASVYADWMSAQPSEATITLIGDRADYPPTTFATDEVHLTRAVPVRLTVTRSSGKSQPMPPGAPVDIEISPAANAQSCSTATAGR